MSCVRQHTSLWGYRDEVPLVRVLVYLVILNLEGQASLRDAAVSIQRLSLTPLPDP